MSDTGRAAVFLGPGKGYDIQEFSIPTPEPDGIVVKVTMGGICGSTPHGDDCIYQDPPDPECMPNQEQRPSCAGDTLSLCVNGKRISVAAPAICATP